MTALAIIHKQDIIQRLSKGETLKDIGASLGISAPAISQQLVDDPDYQAAREQCLDARMEQREEELESAPDMLNLARARELLSHARWRAERECPKRWGKQPDAVPVSLTLNLSSSTLTRASDLLNTIPEPVTITQVSEHSDTDSV